MTLSDVPNPEREAAVHEAKTEAQTGFLTLVREAIRENVRDDGVVSANEVEWDASEKVEDELADYFVAPNERIAREVRDSFVAEIHETNVIERVAEDVDEVDEVEDDRIRAGGRA